MASLQTSKPLLQKAELSLYKRVVAVRSCHRNKNKHEYHDLDKEQKMAGRKPKGMRRGGKMTSKMSTKGGAMGGKKAMNKPGRMKNGGAAKKGAMMKTKGYAKGGAMKAKGAAKGGAMRAKGVAKGGMRKPSSKNSGLYGR